MPSPGHSSPNRLRAIFLPGRSALFSAFAICLAAPAQALPLGTLPAQTLPPVVALDYLPLPVLAQPLIVSVDDPANHVVSPPSPFDGVARLTVGTAAGTFGCSGTLLSGGRHLLTAAHCLDGNGDGSADVSSFSATFNLASGPLTLGGASYALAPGWTGDFGDGADLGIVTLAATAPLAGYGIHSDTSSIGFVADIAGYGYRGFGATGYVSYTFGTLRAGENRMDLYWNLPGLPFAYDFDDGSAARDTIGNLAPGYDDLGQGLGEVLIAPGDSGGPSFLNGKIVGVHSFGASFDEPFDLDGLLNGTFGELGGDTRVAAYAGWVNSFLTPVPEPETYALFAAGLLLLAWRARRAGGEASRPLA